jgi:hypothetical protein
MEQRMSVLEDIQSQLAKQRKTNEALEESL